ncbi:hypothetical protein D9M70_517870 [compost metagenome]
MVSRLADGAGGVEDFLVALCGPAGDILADDVGRQRRLGAELAHPAYQGDGGGLVDLRIQEVGVYDRRHVRIGGADAQLAQTLRAHEVAVESQAR